MYQPTERKNKNLVVGTVSLSRPTGHKAQKAARYADRRTRRNRTRSDQNRAALSE